jgi:AbrB family looped-hinge helix DNA binding protein
MKATATLTSKGQITIPKIVRRLLGLETGDALEFEMQNGAIQVRPAKPRRSSAGVLKAHLPRGWKAPAIEAVDAGIARHLSQRHRRA